MTPFLASPFGSDITPDNIVSIMSGFSGWEDRYRQVIQWGKQLPKMPDDLKSDQVTVSGCESLVWLVSDKVDDRWYFFIDSDARIVRGLIALVLAAFDGKTAQQIQSFDIDQYFASIGLIDHLSASRGNGLKAIVEQIQTITQ
ncbi:cysteine desulfurase, sulfur acceptor subunit CsdE [Vibrio sp. 10N.286.49.B3]|uniref:cysteine desulfurase sulfur acceptor subunit CsdE n=1 Tax=Vibrio sp. 10N.286.49.B3 TaxID=1880855 RepID=UPI000C83609E|nr:cysteine desulfurase sulfur acceptor subunit CsdE [Vibrio sp. 10N.286.49.B3]PMH41155.1 cysteine desulfurase, sulfur acceptor subunit CsdE [Vibrio sp. 10N.286.49.B3]